MIGSETVRALNDRAVELAHSLKATRARKLRIDGLVVESNIHHIPPTAPCLAMEFDSYADS